MCHHGRVLWCVVWVCLCVAVCVCCVCQQRDDVWNRPTFVCVCVYVCVCVGVLCGGVCMHVG